MQGQRSNEDRTDFYRRTGWSTLASAKECLWNIHFRYKIKSCIVFDMILINKLLLFNLDFVWYTIYILHNWVGEWHSWLCILFVPFTLLNALYYTITDDDKVFWRVQHSFPTFDINDREEAFRTLSSVPLSLVNYWVEVERFYAFRKRIKLHRKHSILITDW